MEYSGKYKPNPKAEKFNGLNVIMQVARGCSRTTCVHVPAPLVTEYAAFHEPLTLRFRALPYVSSRMTPTSLCR